MTRRLLFFWLTVVLLRCSADKLYQEITGYLCVRPEYIVERPVNGETIRCGIECTKEKRCQAFSTADGPCQLFVFDACSKSVKDCSCSRRGHVFVKQQPGLEPGALCPSGYGDDLCGVKYRVHIGSMNWAQGRDRCKSDSNLSGLVIMADVMDITEMEHVNMLHSKYLGALQSFFLGGIQTPGSPEPGGGWYWIGCNITIDSSLWNAKELDNYLGNENVVGRYYKNSSLSDFQESTTLHGAVCECVSPFD